VVGTGFCSPPRLAPMPTIRPWEEISKSRLETSEERALETANAVMRAVAGEPMQFFHELFEVEDNVLATLPELDHYATRTNAKYQGPILDLEDGGEIQWPEGDGKRLFVYLRPTSAVFEGLAAFLRRSHYRTVWFAPGLTPQQAAHFTFKSLSFARCPLRMKAVADSAGVAICAAGHGATSALFLAGVPMLLAPSNVEQLLLAHRIVRAGGGRLLPDRKPAFDTRVYQALCDFDKDSDKKVSPRRLSLSSTVNCDKMVARMERRFLTHRTAYEKSRVCV